GQLDEAVEVIEKGLSVLPKNLELRSFHAWLATYKQQWDEAETRWQYVKDNYPDTPALAKEIALGVGEVKMGRGLRAIDGGTSAKPSTDSEPGTGSSTSALFERWESLGDDCEFGLVQRHYGIEPISLLRWTSTKIAPLTLGFAQDFEGVGAVENTQITVQSGEYRCEDKRFGLGMHTFIRVSVEDEKKVFVTMANRMVFLRRKLLEDLEDGEKSYVYKARTTPDDEMVLGLHAAMQRHGTNRLLVVVKADEDGLPGTIRLLKPNVAVGYISDFGNRTGYWDIDHKGWLDLCTGAERTFGTTA
ncbi:MAG: tetratricopeptide repeat protein, partial [Janthinobacterium lividum]